VPLSGGQVAQTVDKEDWCYPPVPALTGRRSEKIGTRPDSGYQSLEGGPALRVPIERPQSERDFLIDSRRCLFLSSLCKILALCMYKIMVIHRILLRIGPLEKFQNVDLRSNVGAHVNRRFARVGQPQNYV